MVPSRLRPLARIRTIPFDFYGTATQGIAGLDPALPNRSSKSAPHFFVERYCGFTSSVRNNHTRYFRPESELGNSDDNRCSCRNNSRNCNYLGIGSPG
jgi:hypothetical protein